MRFKVTGDADAPADNGDCVAAVVVVPEDNVDEVPHVKEIVLEAPFDVPVPFNVAVVSWMFDAGSVVAVGDTAALGVTNDRMLPCVVL